MGDLSIARSEASRSWRKHNLARARVSGADTKGVVFALTRHGGSQGEMVTHGGTRYVCGGMPCSVAKMENKGDVPQCSSSLHSAPTPQTPNSTRANKYDTRIAAKKEKKSLPCNSRVKHRTFPSKTGRTEREVL